MQIFPPKSEPLRTLRELSTWKPKDASSHGVLVASSLLQARAFSEWKKRLLDSGTKLLVCHDMKGGYVEDSLPQGGGDSSIYRFWHWRFVDIFVYFSHHLVTVPPTVWINAAHSNSTKILGTFITEWDEGRSIMQELLSSHSSIEHYAKQLVAIAKYFHFDGWLINIENTLDKEEISSLKYFLKFLSQEMHQALTDSLIIWYDAVTTEGKLEWQDVLNDLNKPFFNFCDGIFTNYSWKTEMLEENVIASKHENRQNDVFVGIDIWKAEGRCGKGYDAVNEVRKAMGLDLSVALFAPAWVYETNQIPFPEAQDRLWNPIGYVLENMICNNGIHDNKRDYSIMKMNKKNRYANVFGFPIYSNFSQGVGRGFWLNGIKIFNCEWNNLSCQTLQPLCRKNVFFDSNEKLIGQSKICFEKAYDGGSSLQLSGNLFSRKCFALQIFRPCISMKQHTSLFVSYSIMHTDSCEALLALVFDGENDRKTVVCLSRCMSNDEKINKRIINSASSDKICVHFIYGNERSSSKQNALSFESRKLFPDNSKNVIQSHDVGGNPVDNQRCSRAMDERFEEVEPSSKWNWMEYEVSMDGYLSSSSLTSSISLCGVFLVCSEPGLFAVDSGAILLHALDSAKYMNYFDTDDLPKGSRDYGEIEENENDNEENGNEGKTGVNKKTTDEIIKSKMEAFESDFWFEAILGHVGISDCHHSKCANRYRLDAFSLQGKSWNHINSNNASGTSNSNDIITNNVMTFSATLTWQVWTNDSVIMNDKHGDSHNDDHNSWHGIVTYDIFVFNTLSNGETHGIDALGFSDGAECRMQIILEKCELPWIEHVLDDNNNNNNDRSNKSSNLSRPDSFRWLGRAHAEAFHIFHSFEISDSTQAINFLIWPQCSCGVRLGYSVVTVPVS